MTPRDCGHDGWHEGCEREHASARHSAPLTPLQRTFLEIMKERHPSYRWHIVRPAPDDHPRDGEEA